MTDHLSLAYVPVGGTYDKSRRYPVSCMLSYVLSYVYSKQAILGLTQEWFRELSFSRLECGVHDKLHISSAGWWDLLLPLA